MSEFVPTGRDAMIAFVITLRLGELAWSARNARRLLAQGAIEYGQGHYPFIVALHVAWIGALIALVPRAAPAQPVLLAAFALLQLGRAWALASLGARWTTRVMVLPGAPLVRRGPYRWLRHPNYLIVAVEIPLLPLAFGAWQVALAFGLANIGLLAWRIRVENAALTRANPPSALPEPG